MNTIINNIIGGFTSWKSTLAGFVAFLALVLHSRGYIEITPEQQATIVAFALLLIGWFSKDTTVAGTPEENI